MSDLAHVLRHLPSPADSNLLFGDDPSDDAAVYRLTDEVALVQTLDFFTPIVDDPYTFGRIAAANSLSDVYAVGGQPLTALNIVAFPTKTLGAEVLSEILRGGADGARAAGISIVGGHTVDDPEPKYGLSVTGTVHPDHVVSSRGAKPGDRLYLTKPLGSGVITTALKAGAASDGDVSQAIHWMMTLNKRASVAMLSAQATACTDISGFGLLGHLVEMCRASGVSAEIHAEAIPLLPGALEYARRGFSPGGAGTNREYIETSLAGHQQLADGILALLIDPQTSGGLLVAVPEEKGAHLSAALDAPDFAAHVGRITEGGAGRVRITA